MYLIECSDDYCKSMYYKPVPGDRFSCQWDVNKTYNYTKDKTLALLYNDLEVAERDAERVSKAGASAKVWKVKKIETIIDDDTHKVSIRKMEKEPVCSFEPNFHDETTLQYLLPGRIYVIVDNFDEDGYPVKSYNDSEIEKGSYLAHLGIHYLGQNRDILLDQYYTSPRPFLMLKYRPVKGMPVSARLERCCKDYVCLDKDIKDYWTQHNKFLKFVKDKFGENAKCRLY